jgi:DNA cross-link repair 1A protein
LQYDFPKQEAVIQFVIDCIQAEAFNPKTLFLIGSYTIGTVHHAPLSLSCLIGLHIDVYPSNVLIIEIYYSELKELFENTFLGMVFTF